MAGRLYRTKHCLDYMESALSPLPILTLNLYNLKGERFPQQLKAPVGTGFEGSILLPTDIYKFFQIGELPRSMWRTYKTMAGSITMRVARAIAEINGEKLEAFVESPLLGGKLLIGRELLNKLVIVLDGPRKLCCTAYRTKEPS